MSEFKKLDPDTAIDIAYDIFLEMAPENLDPADILLFNLQFEERGAVEFVETADNWEEEIGVIVNDHGPFTWGKNPAEAVYHAVVLEEVAKMAYFTEKMSPGNIMGNAIMNKHFLRKHGKNAYYGQGKA